VSGVLIGGRNQVLDPEGSSGDRGATERQPPQCFAPIQIHNSHGDSFALEP
jgi:hypothetical protein